MSALRHCPNDKAQLVRYQKNYLYLTNIKKAAEIREAANRARGLRTTVTALKKAHVPGPSLPLGKVLEAISNAGLFKQGVALVGTAAYQTYPCLVGAYLPSTALMTNDADLLVSSFVANDEPQDLAKNSSKS